jgi:hypothetical protein
VLLPLLGLPALISGWWFARNLVTFHQVLPKLQPVYTAAPQHLALDPASLRVWFDLIFQSSFARLGNMSTVISLGSHTYLLYRLLEVLIALVAVGGVAAAVVRARSWSRGQLLTAILLIAIPVIALLQAAANSVLIDYQPQGRYLFVALPAVAVGAAFAVDTWLRLAARPVQGTVWGAFTLAAIGVDAAGLLTALTQLAAG